MTFFKAFAARKRENRDSYFNPVLYFSTVFLLLIYSLFISPATAGLNEPEAIDRESVTEASDMNDVELPGEDDSDATYLVPDVLEPDEIITPPLSIETLNEDGGKTKHKAKLETAPEPSRPLPSIPLADDKAPRLTPNLSTPDITRGEVGKKELSITFDGGYESDDALAILKTLRERNIKATIFLTGMFIRMYPEIVREIVRDGHEVGNHTMSHPHLTDFANSYIQKTLPGVNKALIARELKKAAELFKSTTGVEMAPLWRAPYGEVNDTIRQWAFEEGYAHVGWTYDYKRRESLDTLDWVADRTSRLYRTPFEIKQRVLNFGRDADGVNGGIVLMHLGTERRSDKAVTVLGDMIDSLTARGYRFVTVSKLLEGNKVLEAVQRQRMDRVMKGVVRLQETSASLSFDTAEGGRREKGLEPK